MASEELKVALQLHFDVKGENVNRFVQEFDDKLRGLGHSAVDVRAFGEIAAQVREGSVAIEDVRADWQALVQEFNSGLQVEIDRDFLGLPSHEEIEQQISAVQEAYNSLAASGALTHEELAQAALTTAQSIAELEAQTGSWADALQNAASSFAGLAASAAGLAVVVRAAIEFESAMADVAKVVDGTDAQFKALGEDLKNMSVELPIEGGASALAAIAAAGGQLGIPIEKLKEFTELVSKMGVAFNMSAEQAGQAIAQMMNVYNLSLDQVRELADAVNVLGNTMATNESDIVEVMTRVGGTAKQFGLSAQQAAALAAAFTSLGKPAQVAGTAINALL
ncbi:MAG: phage tail tape measure protein, partial [Zoogloeaceae bacterium]|nr:phage tail tape measure protein [Zoogloeaceae bacterium]